MNFHVDSERCPFCENGTLHLVRETLALEFRGKTYSAPGESLRCDACGEEFFAPGLLDPLEGIYAQYRTEHQVPGPEVISELRRWLGPEVIALALATTVESLWMYEQGGVPPVESLPQLKMLAALLVARKELLRNPIASGFAAPTGASKDLEAAILGRSLGSPASLPPAAKRLVLAA